MNESRVWFTMPSVEFSTGTTPKCTAPASTSRNTSSMAPSGTLSTAWPKCLIAACWVKVPSGPRNATRMGCSSARHTLITSRNRRAMDSASMGPLLRSLMRLSTWASRSGR